MYTSKSPWIFTDYTQHTLEDSVDGDFLCRNISTTGSMSICFTYKMNAFQHFSSENSSIRFSTDLKLIVHDGFLWKKFAVMPVFFWVHSLVWRLIWIFFSINMCIDMFWKFYFHQKKNRFVYRVKRFLVVSKYVWHGMAWTCFRKSCLNVYWVLVLKTRHVHSMLKRDKKY